MEFKGDRMDLRKYTFTDETITHDGVVLHRIQSLISIPAVKVKAGDLGGFIENAFNLSHEGNCWVGKNAKVYKDARVSGDSNIYGHAIIKDGAQIQGSSLISCKAKISGACITDTEICGNSVISGAVTIDNSLICDNAQISGEDIWINYAFIKDNATILDRACVYGYSLSNVVKVSDNAVIYGDAYLNGDITVEDNAKIGGDARIKHGSIIGDCAVVTSSRDYYIIPITWSVIGYITFTSSDQKWAFTLMGTPYRVDSSELLTIYKRFYHTEDQHAKIEALINFVNALEQSKSM
jgi:carbonic anhydrase/acetyltransferase-like protein (isoleucine patch superfamily)